MWPIKLHFSGISHAQTPAMATWINLLLFDQISRSSQGPLLRKSEKNSKIQNPSRLAYNEFGYQQFGRHRSLISSHRIEAQVNG